MFGCRRRTLVLAAAGTLSAVGCVDRRFVVESNVPAAQIHVDGVPYGPAPADGRYEYAGYRTIQASAPGYETATERVRFRPRWYDYPPLDLIAEIQPFRIEDVRRVRIDLAPSQPVNQAALVGNADALRARGLAMRESVVPDTPSDRPATQTPASPLPPSNAIPRPIQGNLFTFPTMPSEPGVQPGSTPQVGPGTAPGR